MRVKGRLPDRGRALIDLYGDRLAAVFSMRPIFFVHPRTGTGIRPWLRVMQNEFYL